MTPEQHAARIVEHFCDTIPSITAAAIHHTAWTNLEAAIAFQLQAAYDSGEEASEITGEERGERAMREEMDYDRANPSQMAQAWQHRLREAGWQVVVRDGEQPDDIAVTMSEMDAARMLT